MYKNSWPMVRLAGLVLFFQVALSTTATAALISVGTSFGPDTATFDSDTQQQWLDLSLSRPFSYNQVVAELNAGGKFEGYRLASTVEVSNFISNSGILALAGTPAFMGFQSFGAMMDASSQVFDVSGDGCELAFLGVPGGMVMGGAPTAGAANTRGVNQCMTQMPAVSFNGSISGPILPSGDFNTLLTSVDLSFPGAVTPIPVAGVWLVQDVAAVSAPSSSALVLLGLLALIRVAPWHCRSGIT